MMRASALAALLAVSCSAVLPWSRSPEGEANEINIAFHLENNLVFLQSVAINGRTGRFFFGSATPRTVIDRRVIDELGGPRARYALSATDRETFPFTPLFLDLGAAGDAIIGWDTFQPNAITIDYRKGLLSLQKEGIHTDMMSVYHFTGSPACDIEVNGTSMTAIIDTSLPDTLVVPGTSAGRGTAHVVVAGIDLGSVDVRTGPVEQARIGNRLLSKFLISIDYRAGVAGLWRDPRTP